MLWGSKARGACIDCYDVAGDPAETYFPDHNVRAEKKIKNFLRHAWPKVYALPDKNEQNKLGASRTFKSAILNRIICIYCLTVDSKMV